MSTAGTEVPAAAVTREMECGQKVRRSCSWQAAGVGDYDLDRLGPQEFQSLCQALAIKVFGASTRVFGMGRDGGRDAVNPGPLRVADRMWVGHTIIQVKFRARPRAPRDNAQWLRNEVRKELLEWNSEGRSRVKKPLNMIFMTNVLLSGVPGSGLDSLDEVFAQTPLETPLKNAEIWHYDHLCRLLDDAADIRTRYAGFITPGDVLTELHRVLHGRASQMSNLIRRHAEKELLAEQWVRLGQAGSRTNDKLQLTQVALDLPLERDADADLGATTAVAAVIETGDRNLRPSAANDEASTQPYIVLVGGPGQGKTTVSQLISQTYRTALLSGYLPHAANVRAALEAHADGLPRRGMPTPVAKRWPLRIDLALYADRLAGAPDVSILRYLAERIEARIDDRVAPAQLRDWLAAWPWVLVLDGFDEVAAPTVRETLVERVSEFLDDAETADADLLLIATTRPRGYAGEFSADKYRHITLADLPPKKAVEYATTLAKVRFDDDPDAFDTVVSGVKSAVAKDLTARLMRTPLQVTIMSLLLESPRGVPTQRHQLFDGYYQTIYAREISKRTPVSTLLERPRTTIDALHDAIAFEVGVSSELTGHADPAIPRDRVEVVARKILLDDEHTVDQANDLGDRLFRAATERLVLLVPKNDADVGFEIRSLQEYLAARHLTRGNDDVVVRRLRQIAPSAFWRNTWLLASGRIVSERPHIATDLVGILNELDATDMLAYQLGLGAELAADLLDDGFGYPSPRIARQLVNVAVEAFRGHLTHSTIPTADALQGAASGDVAGVSMRLRAAARDAAATSPPQQITALVIAHRWEGRTGTVAASGRQIVQNVRATISPATEEALRRHFTGTSLPPRTMTAQPVHERSGGTLAAHLGLNLDTVAQDDRQAARSLTRALRATEVRIMEHDATESSAYTIPRIAMPDLTFLEDVFSRDSVTAALAEALVELPPEKWAIASATVQIAAQWARSRRVGPGLPNPSS